MKGAAIANTPQSVGDWIASNGAKLAVAGCIAFWIVFALVFVWASDL